MTTRSCVLTMAFAMMLGACAPNAEVTPVIGSDPREARRVLAERAREGPVAMTIEGLPVSLAASEVARLAARGVRGLDVRFEVDAMRSPQLVALFDPVPGVRAMELCAPGGQDRSLAMAGAARLLMAFCDDGNVVAAVEGSTGSRDRAVLERLVWQTSARLFPDDYAESYGLSLFGDRFRVGIGGSVGF